jgi:hypothetical protein
MNERVAVGAPGAAVEAAALAMSASTPTQTIMRTRLTA